MGVTRLGNVYRVVKLKGTGILNNERNWNNSTRFLPFYLYTLADVSLLDKGRLIKGSLINPALVQQIEVNTAQFISALFTHVLVGSTTSNI